MKLSKDEVNALHDQTLKFAKRFSDIAASMGDCPLFCDKCLHEDATRMIHLVAQLEYNLQSRKETQQQLSR